MALVSGPYLLDVSPMFLGDDKMSKYRKAPLTADKPQRDDREKAKFEGYVNVRLDREQEQLFLEKAYSADELIDYITARVLAGYKLTVGLKADGVSVFAQWFAEYSLDPNRGLALSCWSNDTFQALILLWFKDTEITGGEWTGFFQNTSDRSSFG